MKRVFVTFLGFAVLTLAYAQTSFTVRIENVSDAETLSTSEGSVPVPLAPGVWVVHQEGSPLFFEGSLDFGQGLEALAEDGDPSLLLASLSGDMMHDGDMMDDSSMDSESMDDDSSMEDSSMESESMSDNSMESESMDDDSSMEDSSMENESMDDDNSMEDASMDDDSMSDSSMDGDAMMDDSMMMTPHYGVFNTPVGANEAGPLLPGNAYEFSFDAVKGDRLSFATMFVQSNDWFYAPSEEGIALFNEAGEPIDGEISVSLWDAGTEVNEEAGVGENQAPRQANFDAGEAEENPVSLVGEVMLNGDVIKVTITANQ